AYVGATSGAGIGEAAARDRPSKRLRRARAVARSARVIGASGANAWLGKASIRPIPRAIWISDLAHEFSISVTTCGRCRNSATCGKYRSNNAANWAREIASEFRI